MKYESYIKLAFARLGYQPRDNQVDIINAILVEFLDKGKKNVVLDSPTGAGKSIIGAVAAEVISDFRKHNPTNAIFLSSTNILLDQYGASFQGSDFQVMKGADNYPCKLKSLGPVKISANNCIKRTKFFENSSAAKATCQMCEFAITRARKNNIKNIITNYAYFFLDRLFLANSGVDFSRRNIVVWDEAHLINESFVSHCSIYFSKERFDECVKDAQLYFPHMVKDLVKGMREPMALIAADKVTKENLKEVLEALKTFYAKFRDDFAISKENSHDYKDFQRYSKLHEKYEGLFCKINNYTTHDFEVVIDVKPKGVEMTVDPIFVTSMFQTLVTSEFNLFMSGTISKEFLVETLSLVPDETGFVRSENVFPIATKTVVMRKDYMMRLNYATMNEAGTYQSLGSRITHILSQHKGQSGVVFAPSFAFCKVIKQHIRCDHEIICHEEGALLPFLKKFKSHNPAQNKVIISPSMYEGVDLPGDISRFQIMTKAPFASLADKRMKYILEHHQEMYQMMTIMRVIQGIGRSTRYDGDHCRTYFLDTNLKSLFEAYQNIWQHQFLASYC